MSLALKQHSTEDVSVFSAPFNLTVGELHRLSPAQIREAVSSLVSQGKLPLAIGICEAALALNPNSEDMLVISCLLAEVQQDWARAEELLIQLVELQSPNATAQTWFHLARVARCQNKLDDAWVALDFAASLYPNDAMIQEELKSVQALVQP
ncbi:hypothetical protein [Limnohabitans sp. Rim8]|uniref:hypothetical protein n=1 Tax=Limnohabitans sp. Rim8 TaxID=1100718 RepID=UPI0025F5631F|nr:hypothetical protein [Limnohabitans sp. Rim8]